MLKTRAFLFAVALCLAPPAAAQVEVPAPPILLNQLGFETGGAKRAILPNDAAAPLDWQLLGASGRVAMQGRTQVFGADKPSGQSVHIIDFSGFARAGKGYRLRVGALRSRSFAIGANPRGRLAADALAFFYHQRAGVPILPRFVGTKWARPAGHASEVPLCFEGLDQRGTEWPGCSMRFDVHGGWYDAGDQGKYVVNGGISLWTLLNAYERAPKRFPDGEGAIPESGNGVSDLLDEARYEMEFLLRMQVPDEIGFRLPIGAPPPGPPSGPLNLPMALIEVGGMAFQKVADRNWTELPTLPAEDREERLIYPPTTAATLNLAATAAQCARIWRGIDDAFAARCLKAAEAAWAAAKRNPEIYAVGAFTGSGGYGDRDLSDEFYWAAAELYATTSAPEYLDAVRQSPHWNAAVEEPSWNKVATLGTLTLVTAGALNDLDRARLSQSIVSAADRFLADSTRTGYHLPYNPAAYPWGSTSSLLNRAMILAYASDATHAPRYREGVTDAIDYLLGRNPIDQSYISGYGARPMRNPHHRFWAHSLDATLPGPPPGVLSGGPNSGFMSDPVAAKLKGHCAPMACYADNIRAFSLNEVAINWNAPLFWVASWMDRTAATSPSVSHSSVSPNPDPRKS